MRLAITANGPGEVAGWVRPLLTELYALQPDLEAHLFFVPDDYASGGEADAIQNWFPQARVHAGRKYLLAAVGGKGSDIPERLDFVQYLGGDLMHAARLAKRFSAKAATYKFSRPSYRELFIRAFAQDMRNVEELVRARVHRDRIVLVGNLAIDGAFLDSAAPDESAKDGLLIMPGSRRAEVENVLPFCFSVALALRRQYPQMPIAFGISPFTKLDDVRAAITAGGDPRFFAQPGELLEEHGQVFLTDAARRHRFAVVRNALSAARSARLALVIPGTKAIELAALGVPMISIVPLNVPELVAVNGPLTYLNRLPLVGASLKRSVVLNVAKKFKFLTQPNMDAGHDLIVELRGTLMPGHVARVVAQRYEDRDWQAQSSRALAALYPEHRGAAKRMAEGILECASR